MNDIESANEALDRENKIRQAGGKVSKPNLRRNTALVESYYREALRNQLLEIIQTSYSPNNLLDQLSDLCTKRETEAKALGFKQGWDERALKDAKRETIARLQELHTFQEAINKIEGIAIQANSTAQKRILELKRGK